MTFYLKQSVIIIFDSCKKESNIIGSITRIFTSGPDKNYIEVDGTLYDKTFVFPISAQKDIEEVQDIRKNFKKQYDDSLNLLFQLCNKRARGDYNE